MILVFDDLAVVRESLVALLQHAGLDAVGVSSGAEGVKVVQTRPPDLIIIDIAVPRMEGLRFLRYVRGTSATSRIPVLVLTEVTDRQTVLAAKSLGAAGYILKTRFTAQDLFARIAAYLPIPKAAIPSIAASGSAAGPGPAGNDAQTVTSSQAPAPQTPASSTSGHAQGPHAPLSTREKCLDRAKHATAGKALGGVIAQVMTVAASPLGDAAQLADVVARDPVLASRVLSVANSAAYASRGISTTVLNAVRRLGFSSTRNVASAVGIFDAVSSASSAGSDGFDAMRYWQHSFAVASLSEQIERARDPSKGAEAYLVGLCHDLGEILIRTEFAVEYAAIDEACRGSGGNRADVQYQMLGITHKELVLKALEGIGLPDAIRVPIECFHRGSRGTDESHRRSQLLRMAEFYANGLLLGGGADAIICPFAHDDCQSITGTTAPAIPDAVLFRSDILTMTSALAKTDASSAKSLGPPFEKSDVPVLLSRDPRLSAFDPVEAALRAMARVDLFETLPLAELANMPAARCVVLRADGARPEQSKPMTKAIEAAPALAARILWLMNEASVDPTATPTRAGTWPLNVRALHAFVTAT